MTQQVSLVWSTPYADQMLAKIARVSNPANQDSEEISGLIRYMIRHNHWSPFEMVSVCLEINTTRDIGRQILRHRSFSFQEFSQRYADASLLGDDMIERECRMQDEKNRQNSIETNDALASSAWSQRQAETWAFATERYRAALASGVAKEVARAILPEGLTPSRMYMAGTLRSWMHYLNVRLDPSTQKEHRAIAEQALTVLRDVAPVTMDAIMDLIEGK